MEKSVFILKTISKNNVYSRPWSTGGRSSAWGSCFAVKHGNKKVIATNYHVVEDAEAAFIEWEGMVHDCRIVKTAPEFDLALIEPIEPELYKKCEFLSIENNPKRTDDVLVVGFPTTGFNISINKGSISRIECTNSGYGASALSLQVDITVTGGNSGGPIIRGDKVVGVLAGTLAPFSIAIHPVLLEQLIDRKHEFYASIHAEYTNTVPTGLQKFYGLTNRGVVLTEVFRGNKGKKIVPFEPEDAILSINGKDVGFDGRIHAFNDYISIHCYIMSLDPNIEVPVEIQRRGKKMDLKVKFPQREDVVPKNTKQYTGSYVICFGLGFIAASKMFLSEITSNSPKNLYNSGHCHTLELLSEATFEEGFDDALPGKQEVVILTEIIPDARSRGYRAYNLRLCEMNGVKIFNLRHVLSLAREACGKLPFLKFKFDYGEIITLDISDIKTPDAFDTHNTDLVRRMIGISQYYKV